MKVTFRWQQKVAVCKGCGGDIVKGSKAAWYYTQLDSGRFIANGYHMECWLQKIMDWFEQNPYVPKLRLRAPLAALPNEDRAKRKTLGKQYHRLVNARQRMIERGEFDHLDEGDKKIREVREEMEKIGGCPRKWKR